jgi:uncharacterized Zn finger protein
MATSRCPTCQASSFESVPIEVRNHNYQLVSIQCASCGAVVGIMDLYSISTLIKKLAKKLNFNLDSPY